MPLIVQPLTPSSSPVGTTYTAQDIVNNVSQDLRKQLGTSGGDLTILLDYVDRISKEILRSSRWRFLLSSPQQFITEPGVTDYWVGTSGSGPQGSRDTGLNITSGIYRLYDPGVLDRSNNVRLGRTDYRPPNLVSFEYPDGQGRLFRPTNFFHENYSSLIQLFPAPNNQNTYQPTAESPVCTTTTGGALAARTYYVRYSIVDSSGLESDASSIPTTIYIPANSLLVVKSPNFPTVSARGVTYSKYKVYASQTLGSEVVQNSGTSISSGSDFTESAGGLATGTTSAPTVNNITRMDGYLIEFRYYSTRNAITSGAQVLQIPDDYKDVIVSGVNMLGYQFLEKYLQVKFWMDRYERGKQQIIRDKNQFNDGDFLSPDGATQVQPPSIIPGSFS